MNSPTCALLHLGRARLGGGCARCGELGEIGNAKPSFDVGDLLDRLLETVLAEGAALDLLEFVVQLIVLAAGELPRVTSMM